MREQNMRRKWIFLAAPLGILLFIWLGGEAVMRLWNWLLPALFGWRVINFWQAVGLLALCRILFGSWGGRGPRSRFRARLHERWERMTPEERDRFRQTMGSGCGFSAPESGTKTPA
jgi:hypothetical protein